MESSAATLLDVVAKRERRKGPNMLQELSLDPVRNFRPEAEKTRSLSGKVALVTGSTSGIGLGIARALAAAGANVVLNGFGDQAQIDELVAEFRSRYKVTAAYSAADMSKPAEIACDGRAGGARAGRRGHPGEQRRHPARRAGRGVPGRQVGRGDRDQPLGRVPRHPRRATAHEGAQAGGASSTSPPPMAWWPRCRRRRTSRRSTASSA